MKDNSEELVQLGLRIDPKIKNRIRAVADGRSIGFVVTRAIVEYLERQEASVESA